MVIFELCFGVDFVRKKSFKLVLIVIFFWEFMYYSKICEKKVESNEIVGEIINMFFWFYVINISMVWIFVFVFFIEYILEG